MPEVVRDTTSSVVVEKEADISVVVLDKDTVVLVSTEVVHVVESIDPTPQVVESVEQSVLVVPVPTVTVVTTAAEQGPRGVPGPPGSGTALSLRAGEDLDAYVVVTLNGDGEAVLASADTLGHEHVDGLSVSPALTGEAVEGVTRGHVQNVLWSWISGEPVYLGLNGALVQDIAFGSLFSKVLGIATSSDTIFLDPQPAIFY